MMVVRDKNLPICRFIIESARAVRICGSLKFIITFKSLSGGCQRACSCDEKQGENEGMFGKKHYCLIDIWKSLDVFLGLLYFMAERLQCEFLLWSFSVEFGDASLV